jgi:16S rRNA (cytidine1402-2'-O)-methyltransferase
VATPIGNLGDITARAAQTLAQADAIACEDTRITSRLMGHLGLNKPLLAYHDHNAETMRPRLIERLLSGDSLALVSDAGTPLISDPGYKLVRAAREAGVAVTSLPGPSALLAALVLSGQPTDRFLYAGFPPVKPGARRDFFLEFAQVPATLIFYEAPHRLPATLADMAAVLGHREASVARELTKRFEEVVTLPLPDLARRYAESGPPKGEVVVVVAPPAAQAAAQAAALAAASEDALDQALTRALSRHSLRDAVEAVAQALGLKKRDVYARALDLTGGADEP